MTESASGRSKAAWCRVKKRERKDTPLSRHFLKAMVYFSVTRILRLRSASEICTAGLVSFGLLLDSSLHVADNTDSEAQAARDVDDAAEADGQQLGLVAWMSRELQAPLARLSSVPLARVRGIKEAESQLVKQLSYSGIVKVLGFTTTQQR